MMLVNLSSRILLRFIQKGQTYYLLRLSIQWSHFQNLIAYYDVRQKGFEFWVLPISIHD